MSESARKRSDDFLAISAQFQLGGLTTETSHPITSNLSEIAKRDCKSGLNLLFDVDGDVLKKYAEFASSNRAQEIQKTVVQALRAGGNLFFTGCGSTGRLSIQLVSIWRNFWQQHRATAPKAVGSAAEYENRAFSVMAGGDFALIKAVEGFEDYTDFGKKQLGELGVSSKDVVFAITEGGETSFVIGTAWKGLEVGAKVYFVYNNPDDVLRQYVKRSREILDEPRIEKLNLTTGPMAITGSTRMQATTIQLCVLLTIMEMVIRDLLQESAEDGLPAPNAVPGEFLHHLEKLQTILKSEAVLGPLASVVELEEAVYRAGHKNNYFADRFGIDVLTDTTERSPTYCTPPFRKFDDTTATESWAFLFVPQSESPKAWEHIIKRQPKCVEWTETDVRGLVEESKLPRTLEILGRITYRELMRFKVGLDGLAFRKSRAGDCAVAIISESERAELLSPTGFFRIQLQNARAAGAKVAVVYFGTQSSLNEVENFLKNAFPDCPCVLVPVPETKFLLDGITRVAVKTLLNSLSTCTMVRLGRVMGNYMIWVVPSNLKLIDRATRYIQRLSGLDYRSSNQLLFEVIEYVEPRMKSDQAYPPVVGVSVMRARHQLDNEVAEQRLMAELK